MDARNLLPEAHQHPSRARGGLTVLGFAAVLALTLVAD
jgi:hypothetical protein